MKRSHFCWAIPRILAVLVFLSLKFLLDDNLGYENEVDVLPLAKQFADPSWIPLDWYLNQPPGYRLLFNALFGKLIVAWGFLATSIIGRLACYGLIAIGLVLIGKRLGLSLPLLLLAVGVFIYTGQGVAASEWILGGLETKTVAYSLVLLAIALMLAGKYSWMSAILGLATSFHVLVGAWTFSVILAWLGLRWKTRLGSIWYLGQILGLYLLTSVFAAKPVLEQLFTTLPSSTIMPSYIYVFLRLPHHLNPLSWSLEKWGKLAAYLLVLALCIIVLRRQSPSHKSSQQYIAQIELFEFTLLSFIPFVLGLAIAPFDSQGRLLQYYPFRLGDVMLPLNTCLLLACTLQQTFSQAKQVRSLVCTMLLTAIYCIQFVSFYEHYLALYQFPHIEPEFNALCDWVRTSTPTNVTVVSVPANFEEFSWLAERSTIANFKLLPQTKAGILEWYERLSDLSGNSLTWSNAVRYKNNRKKIKQKLIDGYYQLTTVQVEALMMKYKATYFMSRIEHQLNLPQIYYNSRYVLYSKRT